MARKGHGRRIREYDSDIEARLSLLASESDWDDVSRVTSGILACVRPNAVYMDKSIECIKEVSHDAPRGNVRLNKMQAHFDRRHNEEHYPCHIQHKQGEGEMNHVQMIDL